MSRTLTEMILNSYIPLGKEQRDCIQQVIKEWLKQVDLPAQMSKESTRQFLITLADEP